MFGGAQCRRQQTAAQRAGDGNTRYKIRIQAWLGEPGGSSQRVRLRIEGASHSSSQHNKAFFNKITREGARMSSVLFY